MKEIMTIEELEEILNNDENKLIDCWGENCGPCLILKPQIESLESKYTNYKFYSVNCQKYKRLAIKMKIFGLPVVIIYKDGKQKKFVKEQCDIIDIEDVLRR